MDRQIREAMYQTPGRHRRIVRSGSDVGGKVRPRGVCRPREIGKTAEFISREGEHCPVQLPVVDGEGDVSPTEIAKIGRRRELVVEIFKTPHRHGRDKVIRRGEMAPGCAFGYPGLLRQATNAQILDPFPRRQVFKSQSDQGASQGAMMIRRAVVLVS